MQLMGWVYLIVEMAECIYRDIFLMVKKWDIKMYLLSYDVWKNASILLSDGSI